MDKLKIVTENSEVQEEANNKKTIIAEEFASTEQAFKNQIKKAEGYNSYSKELEDELIDNEKTQYVHQRHFDNCGA